MRFAYWLIVACLITVDTTCLYFMARGSGLLFVLASACLVAATFVYLAMLEAVEG
jgi:uncharacterized membrane-anchored protein